MTIATLILAAIAAAGALATWRDLRRARQPEGLVGQAVLVSTKGSTEIEGVVHADMPAWLVLREAVVGVVGSDGRAPAGGLIRIPREHIDIVNELVSQPATRAEE